MPLHLRSALRPLAVAASVAAMVWPGGTNASAASPGARHMAVRLSASLWVASPFKTSIVGVTVPGAPHQFRLTRIGVISATATASELLSIDCFGCAADDWGRVKYRGHEAFYAPRRPINVTTRSRLVVKMTSPRRVGRFKEYTLQPRLRSHRLIKEGCLEVGTVVRIRCPAPGEAGLPVGPGFAIAKQPSCPRDPCLAISRTTGFQMAMAGQKSASVVGLRGNIIGWQIAVGAPTPEQTAFFDANEGGEAEAGLAVLRPTQTSTQTYRLVAESTPVKLRPYFGRTAGFRLEPSVQVERGDVIALTVPTWAPALALGFGRDTTWRASRQPGQCTVTGSQTADTQLGSSVQYPCLYQTAGLAYSATLVPTA